MKDKAGRHLQLWNETGIPVPGYAEGQASPFSVAAEEDGSLVVNYGNPNEIHDGIILVLTAGSSLDHVRFDTSVAFSESSDIREN
ncbi:MAG: hypothetical protein R3F46_14925 [bacterium]